MGNAIASFHISTCHRAADVEKGEIMNDEMKRWTASRKAEVVISMLKHEVNIVDVCRQHDLKQSEVQSWIETELGDRSRRRRRNWGTGHVEVAL